LGAEFSLRPEHPGASRRRWLDTADWRLHQAGWTLEADLGQDGACAVTLRDRSTEAVLATATLAGVPVYAADLPMSAVWSDAAEAVEIRRLLKQVEAETRSQRLAVLNHDGKTTTRLALERLRVVAGEQGHTIRSATLVPIRGYDTVARRIAAILASAGARPAPDTTLDAALRLTGRPEPGAKVGPGVHLTRDIAAREAMAAILDRLRDHVLKNEGGTREQLDIEFLHDFRVAVRRARSLIRRTPGILDPAATAALASELQWLGTLTGPVRDYDVHLDALGPPAGDDLGPLRRYIEDCRDEAQAALLAALDSDRYGILLDMWRTIAAVDPDPADVPWANRTAGTAADHFIDRAFKRVIRRGRAITDDSPSEALHDLRKRAKELRYLLECFQTLYPDRPRAAAVKELKALQDNLGEFQDCQVQAAAIREMGEHLLQARAAPASTLMAMGRLADDQAQRERRAREEFGPRFARFSSPDNRKRFDVLVSDPDKDQG
jgi:CHAD domain-containing protein